MKTTNNVQKAVLKSVAVAVSLVLVSITVNAQDFWESLLERNTFGEVAYAMVEINSERTHTSFEGNTLSNADYFESLLEVDTEEALELEDWMINDANFTSMFVIEEAVESSMKMEDWMSNEALFEVPVMTLEVEVENALELENWMLDDARFEINSELSYNTEEQKYVTGRDFIFVNAEEESLELEAWMVDSKIWGN